MLMATNIILTQPEYCDQNLDASKDNKRCKIRGGHFQENEACFWSSRVALGVAASWDLVQKLVLYGRY